MGKIPAWLYRALGQEITIEPFQGTGPFGDVYGPAFTIVALVEDKRRLVRSRDGSEVISLTTVRAPLSTNCPEGSKVTTAKGEAIALHVSDVDGGRLPVPSHLELALT